MLQAWLNLPGPIIMTQDSELLLKLINTAMPFGKYQGRVISDLPENYLLWFEKKGFPRGELGKLMQLSLEIKKNGLCYLLEPLKNA